MRLLGLLILIAGFIQPGRVPGAEPIVVNHDGSVVGRFPSGNTEVQPTVFRFGLPVIPAAKQWRENGTLLTSWVTNGIKYTQTVLLTACDLSPAEKDPNARSTAILFVNIEGENTNADYAEASAALALEMNGKRQTLELTNRLVRFVDSTAPLIACALEIPESGIKTSRGSVLEFRGNMPPSIKGAMTIKISIEALADEAAAERLSELEFPEELRRSLKTGRGGIATNAPRLVFECEENVARTR